MATVSPPTAAPAPAPGTRRSLRTKTSAVISALDAHGGDARSAWLSLLAGYVREENSKGQFDYLLEDPLLSAAETIEAKSESPLARSSIAEIGVLYELLLAQQDMSEKRKKGQFFTPDDVARFMAAQARQFDKGIWLDPCCGVGNLTYWLAAAQENPERFLIEGCRFLDLDELALLTARTLLTVSFQDQDADLFHTLEPNFRRGDFLAEGLLEPAPFAGEYDYIIMNPPYVRTAGSPSFRTASSGDLYAYFLERAITTSQGIVAITPQTFTNGARHSELRRLLMEETERCDIFSFDNVPDTIFRGFKFGSENTNQVVSTRAAITVAQVSDEAGGRATSRIRTTPLVRWRSAERDRMFEVVGSMLVDTDTCTCDLFPKVPAELASLYETLCSEPTTIADLLAPSQGEGDEGFILRVPTTPRYFISATQRDLSRASMATLQFPDEVSRRAAYLTLNSSIAYLWWRARDGGMTLSRKTLLSTPIPQGVDFASATARRLAKALADSESDNLVGKLNAGKVNENVKHPPELLARLNRFLAPDYADALLALHENSSLPKDV